MFLARDWSKWGGIAKRDPGIVVTEFLTPPENDSGQQDVGRQFLQNRLSGWADLVRGMNGKFGEPEPCPTGAVVWFLVRVVASHPWSGYLSFCVRTGAERRQFARLPLTIATPRQMRHL
jgi:hypothetical protein